MPSRREARRAALNILYKADLSGVNPADALSADEEAGMPIDEFTRELVSGVGDRLGELDELIGQASRDWTVARMPAVDRAALRLACYELLAGEVSPAVAISQAVEAVKELSTEESGSFVNGVLGQIARRDSE